MSQILLSIKPEYAEKILNGEKTFEFRRHVPIHRIDKIVIYSTAPQKAVIGEVEVCGVLCMKKTALWELSKNNAGISREKYRQYFDACDKAYAYKLGKAVRYDVPRALSDYGILQAPQSFLYLKENDNDNATCT